MAIKQECELCRAEGLHELAESKVDGTWMCSVCKDIYDEEKKNGLDVREDATVAIALAENVTKVTSDVTKVTPSEPTVLPRSIVNPETLIEGLSFVMDGIIGGSVSLAQAGMACKISEQVLRVMELQHRMKAN